ncbi:MAG: hypothetical protein ACR2J5_13175 [Geodermatophilaceae bacterium]
MHDQPARDQGLTSGPRGRRLCWELLFEAAVDEPAWQAVRLGRPRVGKTRLISMLEKRVQRTLSEYASGPISVARLLDAFANAVTWARYWQPPDEIDEVLAIVEIQEVLRPLGKAIDSCTADTWWAGALDPDTQHLVEWLNEERLGAVGTSFTGASARLDRWHSDAMTHELASQSAPQDPTAPWSGIWWSTPNVDGAPKTTSALESGEPLGLRLVEDDSGWTHAETVAVEIRRPVRIYEVTGSQAWMELVARYPLSVIFSRRHDWYRTTGLNGNWLIPDFRAVAADYDGVHLTGRGYLEAAGRALPAGADRHTVLAGWDPDQTWWLTDVLTPVGGRRQWVRDGKSDASWRNTDAE